MEAFFKRILHSIIMSILTGKSDATPEEAQAALKGFIAEAVQDGQKALVAGVESLEKNAIDNLDAMDGKMGNLQEQMEQAPGHIVRGVVDGVVEGVLGPLQKLLQNPLGGFFGQR